MEVNMLDEERSRLQAAALKHDYMSIAINQDEKPVRGCFIPWEKTSSAYNMKTPKVTICVDDLQNEQIMQEIKACTLKGCYIFAPLTDYSFLSDFHDLCDLFIRYGDNIRDLNFVQDMPNLFMFYIENAKLEDLTPLIENCNNEDNLPGKRFGFYHCDIKDTSALQKAKFIITELLMW